VFGSKATATFTSASGKQEILTMKGDFFDTQADIIDEAAGGMSILPPPLPHPSPSMHLPPSIPSYLQKTGLVVARIDRKILSGKDIFFGQQTYGVQIAPGVDMALIAALCICLDEKNNEG
jgi:hypothetical protein